jgi:hypothetical protein
MVRQVCIESDRITLAKVVRNAITDQAELTFADDRGLAAAGLVDRWVVWASGRGTRSERMERDLGALSRHGRREDLVTMSARAAAEQPLLHPYDVDTVAFVEPE